MTTDIERLLERGAFPAPGNRKRSLGIASYSSYYPSLSEAKNSLFDDVRRMRSIIVCVR